MPKHPITLTSQQGVMLLEALVAILIFSIGILAIIGMQAASFNNVTDAKFRSEAQLYADTIIAKMLGDDHTTATLQSKYNSPAGTEYVSWASDVKADLPGSTDNPPTIAVASDNTVTVTMKWKARNEATLHSQVVVSQIE
jgi:type IV pilus assembly protein PilV